MPVLLAACPGQGCRGAWAAEVLGVDCRDAEVQSCGAAIQLGCCAGCWAVGMLGFRGVGLDAKSLQGYRTGYLDGGLLVFLSVRLLGH